MRSVAINQFIFPYQRPFAANVRFAAKEVLGRLGLDAAPEVFLVGVAWPAMPGRHVVCIEPEDGLWTQAIFATTPEVLEAAWRDHPDQFVAVIGDDAWTRDQPENIRRRVVSEHVLASLEGPSRAGRVRSFVSAARLVEGYYVVVVVQLPEELCSRFPPVPYRWMNEPHEDSLLTVAVRTLLRHAERALAMPEPGRLISDELGSPAEIAGQAGRSFMRIPFIPGEVAHSELFDDFNAISRLAYEGARGRGRVVLVKPDDPTVVFSVRLEEPVPLRETRWARKLLQMGEGEEALIASPRAIHGVGRVSGLGAPTCSVEFLDRHHWEFRRGSDVLLRARFGEPRLPQEPVGEARFLDNFNRLFPKAGEQAAARFRDYLDILVAQPRGCMLVVADDAGAEAARLGRQGTRIEPTALTGGIIDRASRIDGTILVDPRGVCHAIGVILDGDASDACTPSRGARFNSAMRYIANGEARRLAFVVSEDRTLDIVPLLRPRVSRRALAAMVDAIEGATVDDYHKPRNRLDEHRFYLDADQCARVNAALAPLYESAVADGQLVWSDAEFAPDPEMDESYLVA